MYVPASFPPTPHRYPIIFIFIFICLSTPISSHSYDLIVPSCGGSDLQPSGVSDVHILGHINRLGISELLFLDIFPIPWSLMANILLHSFQKIYLPSCSWQLLSRSSENRILKEPPRFNPSFLPLSLRTRGKPFPLVYLSIRISTDMYSKSGRVRGSRISDHCDDSCTTDIQEANHVFCP